MPTFSQNAITMLDKASRFRKSRGEIALETMAKLYPALNAMFNCELGQEILRLDLENMEKHLLRVCSGDSDIPSADYAMFNYLLNIRIPTLINLFNTYNAAEQVFNEEKVE